MGAVRTLLRRHIFAAALAVAIVPLLTSCSTAGPVAKAPDTGAIGVTVEKRWAAGTGIAENPDKVYFIRLRDNTKLGKQTELFHSNFQKGNQVYLLNAKPGRYVVVAASDTVAKPGTRKGFDPLSEIDAYQVYTTYFDEPLILKTEVAVKPDQFAVAGNFMVKMENAIYFGTKIQRHFHRVIHQTVTDPYDSPIIGADNSIASRATLGEDRSGKAWEIQFLEAANMHLAGSGWEFAMQRRLDELK